MASKHIHIVPHFPPASDARMNIAAERRAPGLSERTIAALLGAVFLLTVPLKFCLDGVREKFSRTAHVRLLMLLCVLGCILLREDVGHFLASGSNPCLLFWLHS